MTRLSLGEKLELTEKDAPREAHHHCGQATASGYEGQEEGYGHGHRDGARYSCGRSCHLLGRKTARLDRRQSRVATRESKHWKARSESGKCQGGAKESIASRKEATAAVIDKSKPNGTGAFRGRGRWATSRASKACN